MGNIMDYIGVGKDNAVTRNELCALMNLPDRAIRRLIEEERNRGEIIINEQDGRGYYQSNRVDDMIAQYRANQSRAKSILRQQKYLRRKIKELSVIGNGQMKLDEVKAHESL